MDLVQVFSEIEFARAVAESTVKIAAEAVQRKGSFFIALAGGNTPRSVYSLLATPEFCSKIDWSRTQIFWSDERCVSSESPDSNYGMAKSAFLDAVNIPMSNIHRIPGELQPNNGADAYEKSLQDIFFTAGLPSFKNIFPSFDLIHLGLGVDGHVASLFPEDSILQEQERWAVATSSAHNGQKRITLTLPVLNSAQNIHFMVTGATKAKIVDQVLKGVGGPKSLPAQKVAPTLGRVQWFLDFPAAEIFNYSKS